MFREFKRRSAAFVVVVVLLLVNFTGPASAGYREGRIGCQLGWMPFTKSDSGGVNVEHTHYLEPFVVEEYKRASFALTIWYGAYSRSTWSVEATPLLYGGAGCT